MLQEAELYLKESENLKFRSKLALENDTFDNAPQFQKLLNLPSLPTTDSADALACSICHANISGSLAKFGMGNRMKSGRII